MDAKTRLALEVGMLVIRNAELTAGIAESVTKMKELEAEVARLRASVKVDNLPANPYQAAENGAMQ